MPIHKIFGNFLKKKREVEEEVEIKEDAFKEEVKPKIRVEILQGYSEVEKIQQYVREGQIVFLNIKSLREKNLSELKRSVDRLKNTIEALNGDIVGIDNDYLLLTPSYARVVRG
ncbi:MAG: cell division protein SepF [Candidatus Aenigmarchaeota archaeon]|nr:cell division protein SepF [Candidatus Aenigmarchaeota archaeon]MCX8190889.1 cell division protein SepF [Candidatus Aenigmarchaeota archaeon]MDW8159892.1 cell division protein SepF [Candidatus Aenigmarchaeota archaeon]